MPAKLSARFSVVLCIVTAVSVLILDIFSKILIVDWIGPASVRHRVDVIGQVLAFHYVENRGVAFGMLPGVGGLVIWLAVAVVLIIAGVIARGCVRDPFAVVSLGCVAGGAIGNVIDRLTRGFVVDFIAVGAWPRFNVADSAVVVGVIVLFWHTIQADNERHQDERAHE